MRDYDKEPSDVKNMFLLKKKLNSTEGKIKEMLNYL